MAKVSLACVELSSATETVNFFWVFARNSIRSSQTISSRARIITRTHRYNPTLNTGTFYATMRQVEQNDVLARPMRVAECLTDYILLRSIVAFSINNNKNTKQNCRQTTLQD